MAGRQGRGHFVKERDDRHGDGAHDPRPDGPRRSADAGADGLCGSCEGCTEEHCTFRDADIEELIRPAVTVPDWAREEADIAPDAKLDCHVDEGSGVITVCETFYDHDLSDIPAELLEALRKSGCCLSVLEDMLMDDDVIYDK